MSPHDYQKEYVGEAGRGLHPDPKPADPWVHRSNGMKCRTCIWYVPKMKSENNIPIQTELGRCRRHAPTMGGYPVVYEADWCGDHRLDENKI